MLALGFAAVGCSDSADDEPLPPVGLALQDVFVGGEDGYPTYRIPSLIEAQSGTLLAFCEGRQDIQDTGDIDLVMKRSFDDGATWTPLQVVVDHGEDTAGNPAPVVDQNTGTIWLPFNTNPAEDDLERRVHLTKSTDDGATWSAPIDITAMVKRAEWNWYATGPGRSIQLESGRFVVPCDHRNTQTGTTHSHVIYSDDGDSWQIGGVLDEDTDESQVAQLDDGSLIINMRDLSDVHRRAVARSSDGGSTWTPTVRDPALRDPSCQGSLLQSPYGLLFSNPDSEVQFVRDHLTVRLSMDGGETWAASRLLREGPSAYSALALLTDGRIGCLYENGDEIPLLPYDRITLATFPLSWLTE